MKPPVAGEGRLPRAVRYIVGNEACERFSFYGMSTILVPYMQQFLGWQRNRAESVYHDFVGAAYAMTVVGGWLSDRFFGRYRTILWLSYGYVLGHAVLAAGDLGLDHAVAQRFGRHFCLPKRGTCRHGLGFAPATLS